MCKAFEQERPALKPLPAERFPQFNEKWRIVHPDGHVEVAKAYYSVQPEYNRRRVLVRWDNRMVRVFNVQMALIATHVRKEPGNFSTNEAHLASEKIALVEEGAEKLLRRTRGVGPNAQKWAAAMLERRGVEGVRVLVGLLSLRRKHTATAIDQACELALSHGAYERLRVIKDLLKRKAPKQECFEFLEEHPIIRSLACYGRVVKVRFQPPDRQRQVP